MTISIAGTEGVTRTTQQLSLHFVVLVVVDTLCGLLLNIARGSAAAGQSSKAALPLAACCL
jgi:hypothetical protein